MPFTDNTKELLLGMLQEQEAEAADYHRDYEDWLEWAELIDDCRSEVGLPLLERDILKLVSDETGLESYFVPDGTAKMTYKEYLQKQFERIKD